MQVTSKGEVGTFFGLVLKGNLEADYAGTAEMKPTIIPKGCFFGCLEYAHPQSIRACSIKATEKTIIAFILYDDLDQLVDHSIAEQLQVGATAYRLLAPGRTTMRLNTRHANRHKLVTPDIINAQCVHTFELESGETFEASL